jgi:RNA polymerase sigma factor (sigma-70 family)
MAEGSLPDRPATIRVKKIPMDNTNAERQLPRRQREVLVLRYYADLSVAEIAETLGISPSNVRACMSRGLAALAAVIGEEK